MILETIAGGLMGGLFRLAPEVLKFFDRDNERKHELAMMDKQLAFEQLAGDSRLAIQQEKSFTVSVDALKEAISGQAEKTGIAIVDAISALVRPIVTYWFMAIYMMVKTTAIVMVVNDAGWVAAMDTAWTANDAALFAGILNFWFMSRIFERNASTHK